MNLNWDMPVTFRINEIFLTESGTVPSAGQVFEQLKDACIIECHNIEPLYVVLNIHFIIYFKYEVSTECGAQNLTTFQASFTRVYPNVSGLSQNEIYACNNKHLFRSNTKAYGGKTQ
jgi:hypothetical protein